MARGQQHILVVDDDPHALRFVRDALAAAGYAVAVTAERASWSPSSAASGRSSCCSTWCCRGGAADYLVKPCSATELTARVGATWRSPPPSSSCCASSVNAERVVPSESLLRQVWGTRRDTGDTERVRAFVRQLRAKLGDHAARPTWIFNVRGVGYRMPHTGRGVRVRVAASMVVRAYATASQNTISQPWNTTARPTNRTPGNCRASRSSAR